MSGPMLKTAKGTSYTLEGKEPHDMVRVHTEHGTRCTGRGNLPADMVADSLAAALKREQGK